MMHGRRFSMSCKGTIWNNVYLNPSLPLEDKCLATVLEVAATTGGRAGLRLGPSEIRMIHQIGNAACSKVCIT